MSRSGGGLPLGWYRNAGVPGGLCTPGWASGFGTHSSGLESVGISEEQTEHVAEVGHESVRCSAGYETIAALIERLERHRFERQVVEPPSTEHRNLTFVLGVSRQLEDVQFPPSIRSIPPSG